MKLLFSLTLLLAMLLSGCSQSGHVSESKNIGAHDQLNKLTTEAAVATLPDEQLQPRSASRVSDRFPELTVMDQFGNHHEFYKDLVADKSVCIVFFYTRCTGSCPGTTVALEKLRHELRGRFAPDEMRFISLTLEPDVDTPEELQEYIDRYQIDSSPDLPNWYYCTGDFEELDNLRRSLGVYDLDPVIDADKTEHAAIITIGNDRLDRWAAIPSGLKTSDLVETVSRLTGNTMRQRYSTILAQHGNAIALAAEQCAMQNCCQDAGAPARCEHCETNK